MAQNLETGLIINKLTGDTHTLTINGDVSVTGLTTDISLLKISQPVIGLGTISASQDLMDSLYSGYTRIDGIGTNFTTSVKINENIISYGLTLYVVDIINDNLLYTFLDPLAFFTGETYTLDGLTRLESFNNGNFIVDNKIYVGKGRNNFDLDTAIGYKALGGDDTISSLSTRYPFQIGQNTAIGYESNRYNVNGFNNTSIGYQALKGGGTDSNTVIGSNAMREGAGYANVCIGVNSLNGNGGSYYNANISIGNDVVTTPTLGSNSNNSVLIGHGILTSTKYANENVVIGIQSLSNGIGAVTFDGGLTYQISGMTENTTLGTRTMYNSDLGYRNTAIGHESLYYITDAYENTAIGYKSGPPSLTYSGLTNTTCVGANSFVTQSDSVILGNPSDTNIMVGIGTSAPSEKLEVNGKTKTTTLRVTSGATPGYVLTSDGSGNATWQPISSSSTTINNFYATNIEVTTVESQSVNTSYLNSNSPLYVNSLDQGNIYFGSTSAITIDLTTNRLGIGTINPSEKLEVNGNTKIIGSLSANTIIISGVTVNPKQTIALFFGHDSTGPLDSSTYHIGNSITLAAVTTASDGRRVIMPKTGNIVRVGICSTVGGTLGTSETSTITINNTTQLTQSTITTGRTYDASSVNISYLLTTPLAVTEGDKVEIRWTTPAWVTNPTAIRQQFNVYLEY